MLARELGVDELVKGHPGRQAGLSQGPGSGRGYQHHGGRWHQRRPCAGRRPRVLCHGGGTDLAKNSADAILLADDLSRLLAARALALRTRKIIKENFAWSIGYNLLVLPLAASGWLPPYLAAAGMSLSSLIVVTNSMRLNR